LKLSVDLFGATFRNPVLLAAGTCGFGEEVAGVIPLDRLGGIVTKSVTLEPRAGNPAPRVAEFRAGMVNSIGLANPGAHRVFQEKLPWLESELRGLQVFVSVAGHTVEEYYQVVEILERGSGFLGFELNLSCPNDAQRGGLPFALDPEATRAVVAGVRARTDRPLLVKLAPNTADWRPIVAAVEESGGSAFTLVNTLPGLVVDPVTRRAVLGAGAGGTSGPAIRAVGVHAVWSVSRLTTLPIVGVGGIASGEDAIQYLLAGASLLQIGTASFWDPRSAPRVVGEMDQFGRKHGVGELSEWIGALRHPRGRADG